MSSSSYLVNIFSATECICSIYTHKQEGRSVGAHNMEIGTEFCLRLFTFVECDLCHPFCLPFN